MSHCDCTTNTIEFGEPSDGYGVSARADRMRARDALIEAIDAVANARHYMFEHEEVATTRISPAQGKRVLELIHDTLNTLTDDVVRGL